MFSWADEPTGAHKPVSISAFDLDDVKEVIAWKKKIWAPGANGLPYKILRALLPQGSELLVRFMNCALLEKYSIPGAAFHTSDLLQRKMWNYRSQKLATHLVNKRRHETADVHTSQSNHTSPVRGSAQRTTGLPSVLINLGKSGLPLLTDIIQNPHCERLRAHARHKKGVWQGWLALLGKIHDPDGYPKLLIAAIMILYVDLKGSILLK